jgi:Spy/CpxP family protein refolding chaperone
MNQNQRISAVALVPLLIFFGISVSLFACSNNNSATPQATESPVAKKGGNTPAKALLKVAGQANSDPLSLLQSEQIKQELNLTDDQVSKLKQVNTDLRAEMDKLTSGVDPTKLSDSEKKQKQEEIDRVNKDVRQKLASILKPEQTSRVKQIFLQVYGFGVLTQQDFKSDLKLTADQDKKMQDLGKELLAKVQQNWDTPKGSQEEQNKILSINTEKVEKLVEESNKEAVKLLTPEQQKTLDQFKGKEFKLDTSKLKRV